jgi:LacI family transcriptional regulator
MDMSSEEKRITIKDIARMAGVSIGTVDRVLHRRGRVKAETGERIRKIIRDTGYTPDFFASQLSHTERASFGVIMPVPGQDSGYWNLCLEGLKRAETDLRYYGVDTRYFYYDRYDDKHIPGVIREASESKCRGFVIAPVVLEPFRKAIEDGSLGGTICFFDTEIPGLPVISRIGQDSLRSGRLAGRLMSLITRPAESVLIMDISENDYHLQQRVDGFIDFFSGRGENRLIRLRSSDTDSSGKAVESIREFLDKNQAPAGVFVPNATVHLYAAACRQLGAEGIRFVGYDNVPENISALKAGHIDFLISQRPDIQGSEALFNLFRASMLGKPVPERIVVPSDIITLENAPE